MGLLINTGIKSLRALANKTKAFLPVFTNDVNDFTTENLQGYDGIIFNNTTRVEKAFLLLTSATYCLILLNKEEGFRDSMVHRMEVCPSGLNILKW